MRTIIKALFFILLSGSLFAQDTNDSSNIVSDAYSRATSFVFSFFKGEPQTVECKNIKNGPYRTLIFEINEPISILKLLMINDEILDFKIKLKRESSVLIDATFTHKEFVNAVGETVPSKIHSWDKARRNKNKSVPDHYKYEINKKFDDRISNIIIDRRDGTAQWNLEELSWPTYKAFPAGFNDQPALKMDFSCNSLEKKF